MKNALQQLAETAGSVATTAMGVGFLIARSGADFARRHPVLTATSLVLFSCVAYAAAKELQENMLLIPGHTVDPAEPEHIYFCYTGESVVQAGFPDGKAGFRLLDFSGKGGHPSILQVLNKLFSCGFGETVDRVSEILCLNKGAGQFLAPPDMNNEWWRTLASLWSDNQLARGQACLDNLGTNPVLAVEKVDFDDVCGPKLDSMTAWAQPG
jgi:hypothetical protein